MQGGYLWKPSPFSTQAAKQISGQAFIVRPEINERMSPLYPG